jgi:ABC-2 type transport system ATP-binding protein
MNAPLLEVQQITKRFVVERPLHRQILAPFAAREQIIALKKVSFSTEPGEILGVVGPNGAGKTTLLRILADLLEPDHGSVTLCGHRLGAKQYHLRGRIGYVSSDERSFFWRLTGKQNLDFFSRLYGLSGPGARRRIAAFLELFGLQEKATHLFRDYSSGTRKKFALIRAIVHQPALLLLDEVTNSLDPPSAERVKSFVREYVCNADNRTGVWSTHRLEEIAEVCDKVLMIDKGTIWFYGSAEDFQNGKAGSAGGLPQAGSFNGKPNAFGPAPFEAIRGE